MFESNESGERVSRRGFLKGTAGFAAAVIGTAALPAAAQQQEPAPGAPSDAAQGEGSKKPEGEDKSKADPAAKKKLVDKDGREYRSCDMCGGNMYKQEKPWTCEQCGFSYEE